MYITAHKSFEKDDANHEQKKMYRMAENFGRRFNLVDWRFWKQSAINFSVMSSLLQIITFTCTRAAARRTSLIVSMEFAIDSCVWGLHSSEQFLTAEKSWLVNVRIQEGELNGVYAVAVKTDATKTVQIKYNNNLYTSTCISISS